MRRILLIFSLLVFTQNLFAGAEVWASHIMHNGKKRDFRVVNPDLSERNPVPLVIVLHGGGGNMNQVERFTGFTTYAKIEKFIVAYPQGLYTQWNDGREIFQSRTHRKKTDDTGFISKMIDAIGGKYNIDKGRVYVAGISNGGFMALRLACELSHKITAVAAVTATMNKYLGKTCVLKSPVSVLIINGTDDPLVPYNGGHVRVGRKKRGRILSTEKTIEKFRDLNDCKKNRLKVSFMDSIDDGTKIQKKVYKCGNSVEIGLYQVIGGGHTWPGGPQYLPEKAIGKVSKEFDATELIWEFFKGKTK